jgi:hypothetical protein
MRSLAAYWQLGAAAKGERNVEAVTIEQCKSYLEAYRLHEVHGRNAADLVRILHN